ncbi:MAG TPA: hypothetical protein VGN63_18995 [Flavisolibacter sp.]|jgi:hypothetical protein|nr:hypothetical protein [Flavisolibacter sp.]
MKKFFPGMLAVVLALAASAFTAPSQDSSTTNDPQLHWFDSRTGAYLGFRTAIEQDNLCPGSGSDCADGFTAKTVNNQPDGDYIRTVERSPQ